MGVSLHRVRAFLRDVAGREFDVCIIDTAAGLFGATADVLSAVTAVIVPQQAEPLGIRSVPKMLEALARMRIVNPKLTILGVVLTMVDYRTRANRDNVRQLREEFEERVFAVEIRTNIRLAEAPAQGQTIFEFDPSSPGAEAYRLLAEEFVLRAGLMGGFALPDKRTAFAGT